MKLALGLATNYFPEVNFVANLVNYDHRIPQFLQYVWTYHAKSSYNLLQYIYFECINEKWSNSKHTNNYSSTEHKPCVHPEHCKWTEMNWEFSAIISRQTLGCDLDKQAQVGIVSKLIKGLSYWQQAFKESRYHCMRHQILRQILNNYSGGHNNTPTNLWACGYSILEVTGDSAALIERHRSSVRSTAH